MSSGPRETVVPSVERTSVERTRPRQLFVNVIQRSKPIVTPVTPTVVNRLKSHQQVLPVPEPGLRHVTVVVTSKHSVGIRRLTFPTLVFRQKAPDSTAIAVAVKVATGAASRYGTFSTRAVKISKYLLDNIDRIGLRCDVTDHDCWVHTA